MSHGTASLLNCLAFSFVITFASAFGATHERVTYTFHGVSDGAYPSARLIADLQGNLYGTTAQGCQYNNGCVFEVSHATGSWKETILYGFSGPDGAIPAASLVLDSLGNLYGTTAIGGDYNLGVAFKLTPSTAGLWTETVLHSFGNGTDGYGPCEMILDASGDLYGITQFGGTASQGQYNGGTVFRLSQTADSWTETLLYSFPGYFSGPDGDLPIGGLVRDNDGTFYGVTQAGGAHGRGAVFALTPAANGAFTESIIHSFHVIDGDLPNSAPISDAAGNLYGTTFFGGDFKACQPSGCGIIYELKKKLDGTWTVLLLRQLQKSDGWEAVGPVAFDSAGNLYAAAEAGAFGWGSILRLTPSARTPWPESIVHEFTNNPDGATPYAGITFDVFGNLFGTTSSGGSIQMGTIYEISH